jgi:hypothetical protein
VGNKIKYHVKKRIFLNQHLDMKAFAIGIVEDTREIPTDDEEKWKWGEIQLTLGDCMRHVTFDFNLNSKSERKNSLYKIRRIAEIVNRVHQALEREAASIEARKVVKPKEETPKAKGAAA